MANKEKELDDILTKLNEATKKFDDLYKEYLVDNNEFLNKKEEENTQENDGK